jgi:predicted transcriptional regulator
MRPYREARALPTSDYGLIASILKVTVCGAHSSDIRKRLKRPLDDSELESYLDYLARSRLLEFERGEGTYRTTHRGERLLEFYAEMELALGGDPEDVTGLE